MSSRYHCCLIILNCSLHLDFWKPVVVGKLLGFRCCFLAWSSNSSLILSITSTAGGGRKSSRGKNIWPPRIGIRAPAALSACWLQWTTQKKFGLFILIDAFTHPAAVLFFQDWGNPTGVQNTISIRQLPAAPSCQIFWLGSGRLVIAVFTIDKIVASKMDATIGSINSSSLGQCDKYRWVLCSPTRVQAMSGST